MVRSWCSRDRNSRNLVDFVFFRLGNVERIYCGALFCPACARGTKTERVRPAAQNFPRPAAPNGFQNNTGSSPLPQALSSTLYDGPQPMTGPPLPPPLPPSLRWPRESVAHAITGVRTTSGVQSANPFA